MPIYQTDDNSLLQIKEKKKNTHTHTHIQTILHSTQERRERKEKTSENMCAHGYKHSHTHRVHSDKNLYRKTNISRGKCFHGQLTPTRQSQTQIPELKRTTTLSRQSSL